MTHSSLVRGMLITVDCETANDSLLKKGSDIEAGIFDQYSERVLLTEAHCQVLLYRYKRLGTQIISSQVAVLI